MARKPKPVRLSLAQLDELLYLDEQTLRKAVMRLRDKALIEELVFADSYGETPAENKKRLLRDKALLEEQVFADSPGDTPAGNKKRRAVIGYSDGV